MSLSFKNLLFICTGLKIIDGLIYTEQPCAWCNKIITIHVSQKLKRMTCSDDCQLEILKHYD